MLQMLLIYLLYTLLKQHVFFSDCG